MAESAEQLIAIRSSSLLVCVCECVRECVCVCPLCVDESTVGGSAVISNSVRDISAGRENVNKKLKLMGSNDIAGVIVSECVRTLVIYSLKTTHRRRRLRAAASQAARALVLISCIVLPHIHTLKRTRTNGVVAFEEGASLIYRFENIILGDLRSRCAATVVVKLFALAEREPPPHSSKTDLFS